jgi:hypothetical protein
LAAGRRVHERYAYRLPIVIVHDGREISAYTVNLSLGGAFVQTETELAYGTQARARFRLPTLKEDTEVPVTVRWKTSEGLGVQFGSLRALEVWALNQLFKTAEQAG